MMKRHPKPRDSRLLIILWASSSGSRLVRVRDRVRVRDGVKIEVVIELSSILQNICNTGILTEDFLLFFILCLLLVSSWDKAYTNHKHTM